MTEILIIGLAVAIGAFAKGATGTGLPQVAIPVVAMFLGVEHAVVVMAIPAVASNSWMLWQYRSHLSSSRDLPALLLAGSIGAVLGTFALKSLDTGVLSVVVATIVLVYVILFLSRSELVLSPRLTRYLSPPLGLGAGLLQGATGISGPLVSTYLHGFRLKKEVFVVSQVALFQVYGIVQMLTLLPLGLYDRQRLVHALLALILIILIMPLGAYWARRLSHRAFELLVLVILVGSAAKLLYDGMTASAN